MKNRARRYSKEWLIKNEEWDLKFSRKIKEELHGYCEQDNKLMCIAYGQNMLETFATLIHESWHGYEKEFKKTVNHQAMHVLDTWTALWILENWDKIKSIVED